MFHFPRTAVLDQNKTKQRNKTKLKYYHSDAVHKFDIRIMMIIARSFRIFGGSLESLNYDNTHMLVET